MKYFKRNGEVFAFESDGSQDDLIADDMVTMTADEVAAHVSPPGAAWVRHQAMAQQALDASDMVALRCFKAGVAFPAEWQTYVTSLRAIVRASAGDPTAALPARPSHPAGT